MIRRFLSLLRGCGSGSQAQAGAAKQASKLQFEIVETSGDNALARWEELKAVGRGAPVVVKDLEILSGQAAELMTHDWWLFWWD